MPNFKLEPLAKSHCECGENPYWNPDDGCVYWTDIPKGRLFRLVVASGHWSQIYSGEGVGGFTLQRNGDWLLFRDREIAVMKPDGTVESIIDGLDSDTGRFNDVMADTDGSVLAGTLGSDGLNGGIYGVATDGKATKLWGETDCSNGMGISPDGKKLVPGPIRRPASSTSSIATLPPARLPTAGSLWRPGPEGIPDGMAIDVDGNIWSARWDGYGIYKFSPEGEELLKIEFPVAQVSSLCFGGPAMDDLYVADGGSDGSETMDGTLYRVHVGVRGLPEHRSNIVVNK